MNKIVSGSLLVSLLAALAGLSGCGTGEAQSGTAVGPAAAAPLPVAVVAPERKDMFASHETTTTLAPDADAPVPARVAGQIMTVLVEEGDAVVAGQVLARIDGERLKLEAQHAKASLEQARREYERNIRLQERGLVSAAAFEGLKFLLDELEASYALKQLELGYTAIRAPVAGIVTARAIKVGNHVDVGDLTFRVTDTKRLVAYLQIPQNDLSRIAVGQPISLEVDAMPGRLFPAKVERISPTIDARSGTFRVTAYIENGSASLAPGMFGRFSIAYEKHSDVLTIPAGAVVDEDTESVVYVVVDGKAERRPIRIGLRSNDRIEVLEGVDANENVVVTGQSNLREGSRVYASVSLTAPLAG